MFPVAMLVVTPYLLIATADRVPTIDVNRTCRMSAQDGNTPAQDLRVCILGQNSAREELTKEWTTYSAADRQRCTSMAISGYLPSYVELVVCLQIARDVKKVAADAVDTAGFTNRPAICYHGRSRPRHMPARNCGGFGR